MTKAKACCTCRDVKSLDEFHKDRTRKDGRGGRCKKCSKEYGKTYYQANRVDQSQKAKVYLEAQEKAKPGHAKAVRKAWHKANRMGNTSRGRQRRYNLTPEKFAQMYTEQEGKCAVCKNDLVTPCVDHDHDCCESGSSCGKCIRGLLCVRCNTGIGLLGDSQVNLLSAARYVGAKRTSQE